MRLNYLPGTLTTVALALLSLSLPAAAQFSAADSEVITVPIPVPPGGYSQIEGPPAVADFNKDGHADMAIAVQQRSTPTASDNSIGFMILLGNGYGSFKPQPFIAPANTCPAGASCGYPVQILAGDFNGDGNPDILLYQVGLLSDKRTMQPLALLCPGNGDGTFGQPIDISSYVGNQGVSAFDLRGNGILDLVSQNVVVPSTGPYSQTYYPMGVALGNGDGTFQKTVQYGPTEPSGPPGTLNAANLGNGHLDLLTELYTSQGDQYEVLLGNGTGTFQAAKLYPFEQNSPDSITLGRFGKNHSASLLITDINQAGFWLANKTGTGTFGPFVQYPITLPNGDPLQHLSGVVGDLNGDGIDDVFFEGVDLNGRSLLGDYAGWMLGNGDGTFAAPQIGLPPLPTLLNDTLARLTDRGGLDVVGLIGPQPNVLTIYFNSADRPVSSTTTITSSANPDTYPGPVNLTITVAGNAAPKLGGPAIPPGAVTIFDNGKLLASRPLVSGTATLANWTPPVGSHALTATYSGDSDYYTSTSAPLQLVVNGTTSSTSLVLTSTNNPSIFSNPVSMQAAVTGQLAIGSTNYSPLGTVGFYANGKLLATRNLVSGQASLSLATLPVGSDALTATYNGSSIFAPSTSSAVTQTVAGIPTSIQLTSNANPATAGSSVTFTATISRAAAPDPAQPVGYLYFYDGTTSLGAGLIQSGIASITTSALATGTHTITAKYPSGSTAFAPSTSNALSQVVN